MADNAQRPFRAAAWKEQASAQIDRLASIDFSLRVIADVIGRIEAHLIPSTVSSAEIARVKKSLRGAAARKGRRRG